MIKFIYFDVGGVVIRDFSGTNKWEELKTGMGIKPEQAEAFNEIFDKYEPEVCVGRDVETLVPMLKEKLGWNCQTTIRSSTILLIDLRKTNPFGQLSKN